MKREENEMRVTYSFDDCSFHSFGKVEYMTAPQYVYVDVDTLDFLMGLYATDKEGKKKLWKQETSEKQ